MKNKTITCLFLVAIAASAASGQQKEKVTFDDHVKPIFNRRCASCHNSGKRSGDLDVTNFTNFMQGGSSGAAVEPGDASSSYLYSLITHEDSPEMPPSGKIPDEEIAVVKNWIDGGALENKGSKAMLAKPKFELKMSGSATSRPETPPLSARLPLEPRQHTSRSPAVPAIATSPWAPVAAIAAARQVLLVDTAQLKLKGIIHGSSGQSKALKFSRSGDILLMTDGLEGSGAKVRLWNVREGKLLMELAEEVDTILAADISPDHSLVAVGGPQKMVRVYSTATSELIYEVKKHTDWVTSLEFSPDGKYLASGDRNGGLHVWFADSGEEHLTLKAHNKLISGISWRWDAKLVASSSEDSTVRLWEIEEGKQVKNWGAHGGGVTSLEFTRDGHLVTCGRDKVSKVWQQDGKMIRQVGGLQDVAMAVSYCDETNKILTSDWAGNLLVHGLDGKLIGPLSPNPPTLAARLATANQGVSAIQQEYQPLSANVSQLTQALAGSQNQLKLARGKLDENNAKLLQIQKTIAGVKQQLAATVTQQETWRQELERVTATIPSVDQARVAAAEAVKKLSQDAELASIVQSLTAKLGGLKARNAELGKLVFSSNEKKATTQAKLAELEKSMQSLTAMVQTGQGEVAQYEKQVGTVNDQLAAARKSAAAVKTRLDAAVASLKFWQAEQVFAQTLASLNQKLNSAETEFLSKAESANEKLEQLKSIQAEVQAANQVRDTAKSSMQEIEKQIRALKGIQ